MLAIDTKQVTLSFLGFASVATHLLNIKVEDDYNQALDLIDTLFQQAHDDIDDPLNALIDLLSRAVEKYESSQQHIIHFERNSKQNNQEISLLKVLMQQHSLTLSDFKEEIGSKPLVSMILNGKRNLTKNHIKNLSRRFRISPALFYAN